VGEHRQIASYSRVVFLTLMKHNCFGLARNITVRLVAVTLLLLMLIDFCFQVFHYFPIVVPCSSYQCEMLLESEH